MFYGFKDSKCYHLLQRITSAICTMCILFNLFPMSIFNAYAAEGGESSTITKNTISADGEIQLMDGWTLVGITDNVTSSGSYADDYDTGFYNDIKSNYENGYNSEDTALEIGTAKQLAAFSKYVNDGNDFSSKYVKLVDNIDLNLNKNFSGIQYDKDEDNANKKLTVKVFGSVSHSWNPIGTDKTYFGGTFIGNNHTIKNMLADSGLFKTVSKNGVIKGVNVKCAMVSGKIAGGIAGKNNKGTISNCTNSGAVSGSNCSYYVAGIAGNNKGGTISNCTNSGAVSYSIFSSRSRFTHSGGIAGNNESGTISNCTNSGAVSASVSGVIASVGGIAGSNNGVRTISDCTNRGEVSLSYSCSDSDSDSDINCYAGGITGANNIEISNCTNSGAVSLSISSSSSSYGSFDSWASSGGIAGCNKGTISNCTNSEAVSFSLSVLTRGYIYSCSGGIVGDNGGRINTCDNSGAVSVSSSKGAYGGGIAGYNNGGGRISNCINSGAVSVSSSEGAHGGGIVGLGGTVQYCLSTSKKIEGSEIGGIDGSGSDIVNDCYYDKDIVSGVSGAVNGSDDTDNVKGLSTSELQSGNNLFNNDMWLYKAGYYPVLDCINFAIIPSISINDTGNVEVSCTIAKKYEGHYNIDNVKRQWYRNNGDNYLASGDSYTLQAGDEKDKIICRIYPEAKDLNSSKYIEAVVKITKKVPSISDIPTSVNITASKLKEYVNPDNSDGLTYQYKSENDTEYKPLPGDDEVIAPGNYVLRVTYAANDIYYGKTIDKKFTTKADYDEFEVEDNYTYTGKPWEPKVTSGGKTLRKDIDYTIKCVEDMTNVGDKLITVELKGEYVGKEPKKVNGKIEYLKDSSGSSNFSDSYTIKNSYKDNKDILWVNSSESVNVEPTQKGWKIASKLDDDTYLPYLPIKVDELENATFHLQNEKGERTDEIKIKDTKGFTEVKRDQTSPTGTISIDKDDFKQGEDPKDSWSNFISLIKKWFKYEEKKVVTIDSKDTESGVKSTEYFIANEDLLNNATATTTDLENKIKDNKYKWYTYNEKDKPNLPMNEKYVVYAKITDNVDNVTYISSDGIKIYKEAEIVYIDGNTTLKKGDTDDVAAYIKLNEGSLDRVVEINKDGEERILNAPDNYSHGSAEGNDPNKKYDYKVNFSKRSYLDKLDEGDYTLRLYFKVKLGESYEEYYKDINLNIYTKPWVTASDFEFYPPTDTKYNGKAKKAEVNKKKDTIGDVTVNYYKDGAFVKPEDVKDVGTYIVEINVAESDNYSSKENLHDSSWTFEITAKDVEDSNNKIEVALNGSEYYDNKAPTIIVKDNDLGKDLVEDEDYTLNWTEGESDKKGTGRKAIDVEFTGNYKGHRTAECNVDYLPAPSDPYDIIGVYTAADGKIWAKSGDKVTVIPKNSDYTISTQLNVPGEYQTKREILVDEFETTNFYLKNEKGQMTDKVNGKKVSVDKKSPEVKVSIDDEAKTTWKKLLDKITFGLFDFDKERKVTIKADDTQSGVKSTEYLLANEELFNANDNTDSIEKKVNKSDKTWLRYKEGEVTLSKDQKYVVYAKVTDNVGNVTYVSSNGIVIYSKAEADNLNLEFTKSFPEDKTVKLTLNKNEIKGIYLDTNVLLTENEHYTRSNQDGKTIVTFDSNYLAGLKPELHTLTIKFENSLTGKDTDEDITINLGVKRKRI